MLGVSSDAWLSLTGVVVGALLVAGLAQLDGAIRDRRQARDRRLGLQRDTLMALQETIHDLGRSYQKLINEDLASFEWTWKPARLPEELNEGVRTLMRDTDILQSRLERGDLHEDVQRFRMIGYELAYYDRPDKTKRAEEEVAQLGAIINDKIGERLREL